MPAARARTWATRDASSRPGSSVIKPTSPGVTVITPTSAGGMPPSGPAGAVLLWPQPASRAARLREVKARWPRNGDRWGMGAAMESRAGGKDMVYFLKEGGFWFFCCMVLKTSRFLKVYIQSRMYVACISFLQRYLKEVRHGSLYQGRSPRYPQPLAGCGGACVCRKGRFPHLLA